MGTKKVALNALGRVINRDLRKLKKRVITATHTTASFGASVAFIKAPLAFGGLRNAIIHEPREDGAKIIATAPYSAAVENGSRPHWVPLGALVAWVRLRGAEAVEIGPGAIGHQGRVGSQIAGLGNGESTPVDAAVVVAKRIQIAIAKRGTKPNHFMLRTLPEVNKFLDDLIKDAFGEDL